MMTYLEKIKETNCEVLLKYVLAYSTLKTWLDLNITVKADFSLVITTYCDL